MPFRSGCAFPSRALPSLRPSCHDGGRPDCALFHTRPPGAERQALRGDADQEDAGEVRVRGRHPPRHRKPMPRRKPSAFTGSADVDAMIDQVAPAVLELLGDGVPRSKAAIVEALAGRHAKDDVVHTLIRLAVTGQVEEAGGKYMPAASEP